MTAFDQSQPEFWIHQGCQLCETEQYAAAIAAFDHAIALDASRSKAWNNRGNALSGMKRQAEALSSYDRAVALDPNYHQAWFNRALLLTEMAAYGNAVESYDRAIALIQIPFISTEERRFGSSISWFSISATSKAFATGKE